MHSPTLGDKCIAQFAHLKQLYQIEEGNTLKVPKLLGKCPSTQAALRGRHRNMPLVKFFFNYLLDESGVSVVITFTDFDVGDAGSVHTQAGQI